jgi:hypothetical protein
MHAVPRAPRCVCRDVAMNQPASMANDHSMRASVEAPHRDAVMALSSVSEKSPRAGTENDRCLGEAQHSACEYRRRFWSTRSHVMPGHASLS